MSDSQKFGGGPSVEVAEPPAQEEFAAPSKFNPKMLGVAGGVIVVLALAAYFLLFSGGGTDTSQSGAVVPAPRTSHAASQPGASATPVPTAAVVGTGLSSGGRDPFAPLVTVASPTASATTTPTGGTSGGTTTPTGLKSTLVVNGVDFATQSANVVVDGKTYVAHIGELFAKYYVMKQVLSGTAQCGTFVFGDLTSPVTVCKGQQLVSTS